MNPFILKKPLITEKTYRLVQERNSYTFEVDPKATKGQIREVVEETFNVKVLSIQTTTVAGKNRRTGTRRTQVRYPDRKKAIVTLPKDQKISLFEVEAPATTSEGEQK
jgi:large subunit ribosomal protein L23